MVSIDSIKTAFLIAELNNLKVMAVDVGNTYLHGYTMEKIYTVAGPEFGKLQKMILVCAKSLYGLKTSMGRWHEALCETLCFIGFQLSKADLDLWLMDASDHWECIVVYFDDLLYSAGIHSRS